MKVAIPTFGTRVAPRFDCAQSFLLVGVEDGQSTEKREIESTDWAPHQRAGKLVELGVDTVICGAIDRWSGQLLEAEGITVYGWVTGEVEDALSCLLRGELVSQAIMGAGGHCCGRWRFRGGVAGATPESAERPPSRGRGMGRRGGGGRGGGGGRRGPGNR